MIQAFTDLVGTSAVPALSINIEELTELTPAAGHRYGCP